MFSLFSFLAFNWISILLVVGSYVACDWLGLRAWRNGRRFGFSARSSLVTGGWFLLPYSLILMLWLISRAIIPQVWMLWILYAMWCQLVALAVLLTLSGVSIVRDPGARPARFKWARILAGSALLCLLAVGSRSFTVAYAGQLCGSRTALAAFPDLVRDASIVECGLCCDYPPLSTDRAICWKVQQRAVCDDLVRDR